MKKILIMYATFGNGHRAIAKYIEEYFKSRDEEIEIKNIDILSYITPLINKISTKVSNKMILSSNPLVWGLVYKYFDHKVTTFGSYELFTKIFDTNKLKEEIIAFNPDLTISTHFFASTCVSRYKKKKLINTKLITIITDYQSHELWLKNSKIEDALIVATKDEKKEMVKKGVEKSKIKIYGIPISNRFNKEYDKNAILEKYSLPSNKPVYLFFGGGGSGSKTSLPYLKKIIKLNANANFIYVAGNNKKLLVKAKKMIQKYNAYNIRVFGFVTNIPELMTISDAVITKPGGITVTECLTLNKPMILINKTAGHEKGNFKYLVKRGYALNGSSLRKFTKVMESLEEDNSKIKKAHEKMLKNKDNQDSMQKLYKLSEELLNCKK